MSDEGLSQNITEEATQEVAESKAVTRKRFFGNGFLIFGLTAAYGTLLLQALRYLLPKREDKAAKKVFITTASKLPAGASVDFTTPDGESYLLTNTGADGLIAFSSRCPHLGCKVHWQNENNRFFCPCHGGAFDQNGAPTAGPPKAAGQVLKPCKVKVEGNAIYALLS